jgi:hypothetical protein
MGSLRRVIRSTSSTLGTVISIMFELLSSRRLVQAVNVAAIVELLEEIYVDELGGLGLLALGFLTASSRKTAWMPFKVG